MDPCQEDPCGLHGTCQSSGTTGDYTCRCQQGHRFASGTCVPLCAEGLKFDPQTNTCLVEGNNNIYGVYCLLYDTVPTPHRITDCILCLIVTTLHDLTFSFRKWILKDVLSDFKTYSKSVSIDIILQTNSS